MFLGVGPWQIKHYAKTVLEMAGGDIRFEDGRFYTVVQKLDPHQARLPLRDRER